MVNMFYVLKVYIKCLVGTSNQLHNIFGAFILCEGVRFTAQFFGV